MRLLLRRAFAYYLVMLGLFTVGGWVYVLHPVVQPNAYDFFVRLYIAFYQLFLYFGFFYYLLEGIAYSKVLRRHTLPLFTTPAIFLLLIRRTWEWIPMKRRPSRKSWSVFFANRHVRTRLLGFLIKAFFGALMITFAAYHYRTVANVLGNSQRPFRIFEGGYNLVYHCIFLVDAGMAAIGYYSESPFLRNRLRSVDPDPFSWVVTLACYPPFSESTARLLPLSMSAENHFSLPLPAVVTLKVCALLFFLLYVWATLALNVKFSNLTHRGIVHSGPYAFMRHPAYFGKNLAWWCEYLPYLRHGVNVIPLLLWNVIYVLRGIYEEKHLSQDPEYQEYQKRVRYRFIPGVV